MIPVLGVPILTGPDLLEQMLYSVDEPVERIVVVANGGVEHFAPLLATDLYWLEMPENLGVAASWNLIMKATISAPWWLLSNHDIIFGPGDLAKVAERMKDPSPHLVLLNGFAAFAINGSALDTVGWFDENYHPAYYEDNDYTRRCLLAGVPIEKVDDHNSTHEGSATISDPVLRAENERTFFGNRDYHIAKWGKSYGQEVYFSPFSRGGSVRDWDVTRQRILSQRWRT